jgi:phosphatidylglycerophosphate synthase
MKKILEKFILFLHRKYGLTPDILTYIRIFSAPWLALLISRILAKGGLILAIITIILYLKVVATDFWDGILARAISKTEEYDHYHGRLLDKLSDKILIIFILIPFGLNLFTVLIILAESLLVFQTLRFPDFEMKANYVEKIKKWLQIFLIPILILQAVMSSIPDMAVYAYIVVTIIFTYFSVYSHFFYSKKDLHY